MLDLVPDSQEIREFVRILTGDAETPVTWQTFDDSEQRRGKLARVLHGSVSDCLTRLEGLNRQGAGVFLCIAETDLKGRKKANVKALRALFVDHDDGQPDQVWTPEPSLVVDSVNGPHAYWLLDEASRGRLDDFTRAQEALIARWGSDPKVKDLPRVMRVPGFWHRKGAPKRVSIRSSRSARVYSLEEVAGDLGERPAAPAGAGNVVAGPWAGSRGAQPEVTGDLSTLDVVALFTSRGWYRRDLGGGKHAVVCPWAGDHTKPNWDPASEDTSTVAYEPSEGRWPAFDCKHAHCDGHDIRAVVEMFGRANVDRFCAKDWLPPDRTMTQEQLSEAAARWVADVAKQRAKASAPAATPAEPVLCREVFKADRDAKDRRDHALHLLATHPSVYVMAGQLARLSGDGGVEFLSPGAVESCLVDRAEVIKVSGGKRKPAPVPADTVRMVKTLSLAQAKPFRQLHRVTRTPFWDSHGRPVTAAGYDAGSHTVLVDPPQVADDLWPDAGGAMLWLCNELLGDFPWGSVVERANFLGAMLTPLVRPMIYGPLPMIMIEASKRGSGKSLLAQIVQVVHGLQPEVSPLPTDEREVEKRILTMLMDARPIHVWDNVRHAVASPSLEATLTTPVYTGRILGVSSNARLPVRVLSIMTVNNARVSEDLARRVVRVRLVPEVENPEDRQGFRHRDILAWCKANRRRILSALWQMTAEWVAAGRPETRTFRPMGSYQSFADVIGGILSHSGDPGWFLGNLQETKDAVSMDDEWAPFLAAWWRERGEARLSASDLFAICDRLDLMLAMRGDRGRGSQVKRLGHALVKQHQAIKGGLQIHYEKDSRTAANVYWLKQVAS